MKCIINRRPFAFISVVGLILVTLSGVCLRVFERSIEGNQFGYVWNGFWVIVITETTVGYGDIIPLSHLGRIICIISALFGTFLISFFVLVIHNSSELSANEMKLYEDFKYKVALKSKLKEYGVKLIQRWWRLVMQRRKKNARLEYLTKFQYQISLFKLKRSIYKSGQSVSLSDQLETATNDIDKSFSDVLDYLKISKSYQAICCSINKDEFSIQQKLKSIQHFLDGGIKDSSYSFSSTHSMVSSGGDSPTNPRRVSQRLKFESFQNVLRRISSYKPKDPNQQRSSILSIQSSDEISSIYTIESPDKKDSVFTIKITSCD
jgi:hypothetical protein